MIFLGFALGVSVQPVAFSDDELKRKEVLID